MIRFRSCHDVNQLEKFWLPNSLNDQYCHYIKYGANGIGNIMTSGDRDLEESMLHQLEKLQNYNRKFVYYIKMNDNNSLYPLRYPIASTRRPYTIHFNLENNVESRDIMKSYILGRLIDYHIQRQISEKNQELTKSLVNYCIRRAEWQYTHIDFKTDIEEPMNKVGWNLDFIYLD